VPRAVGLDAVPGLAGLPAVAVVEALGQTGADLGSARLGHGRAQVCEHPVTGDFGVVACSRAVDEQRRRLTDPEPLRQFGIVQQARLGLSALHASLDGVRLKANGRQDLLERRLLGHHAGHEVLRDTRAGQSLDTGLAPVLKKLVRLRGGVERSILARMHHIVPSQENPLRAEVLHGGEDLRLSGQAVRALGSDVQVDDSLGLLGQLAREPRLERVGDRAHLGIALDLV